jgi:predicted O-methyltransferase YrrM
MKKYYYYLTNPILRKILISIILRKIKKLSGLQKEIPFNLNQINISKREDIIMKYLETPKTQDPLKKYKKLYFNQKKTLLQNPYSFGGGADQEFLYNICKRKNIINILETGVANGWSTLAILLAIRKDHKKTLTSLDIPYPYKNSSKYIGSLIPNKLKNNKWSLILGIDYEKLNDFNNKNIKFDLVHYDSDKNYFSKIRAFDIIWEMLNEKGFLISDDVSDNNAFTDFVIKKNAIYYIYEYENKFIGIAEK